MTAQELKSILDAVMTEIDVDPDAGPRLRAAAAPLRFDFPDLKLSLTCPPPTPGLPALGLLEAGEPSRSWS